MDKDGFFSWQPELSTSPPADHLPPSCFLNLNWDHPVDHSAAHFESALSSLVSSPSSAAAAAAAPDSFVIRELIGRLGSICNSGELSPPSSRYQSATASCYSTPLNSPPKLNLSIMDHHHHPPPAQMVPFSADPGFVERAARFSCFGRSSAQIGHPEAAGELSRVSSSQSLKAGASQMGGAPESNNDIPMLDGIHLEGRELGNAFMEESSAASDRIASAGESNARKRKAAPKGKAKVPPKVEEEDTKRFRSSFSNGDGKDSTAIKPKIEQNGGTGSNGNANNKKQGKESNAKLPEPPKDYIHVRARRGQATDSHSLAERVRRERISERMKLLQDLVPGCNKVTGKAVMLDEIINYVQSLQRQVEFLSMKLSTVDVLVDLNMEKEMNQLRGPVPPRPVYPLEATSTAFSYAQGTPLQNVAASGVGPQYPDTGLRRMLGMQLSSLDGFGDTTTQIGAFWEDDLQSVVQMGFVQNQEAAFSSQSFHDGLNRRQA